ARAGATRAASGAPIGPDRQHGAGAGNDRRGARLLSPAPGAAAALAGAAAVWPSESVAADGAWPPGRRARARAAGRAHRGARARGGGASLRRALSALGAGVPPAGTPRRDRGAGLCAVGRARRRAAARAGFRGVRGAARGAQPHPRAGPLAPPGGAGPCFTAAARFLGARRLMSQRRFIEMEDGMTSIAEVSLECTAGYAQAIRAGHHQLTADEPKSNGGTDTGPAPYELLLSALGACTSITLRMYADRKGWTLGAIDVRLRMLKW